MPVLPVGINECLMKLRIPLSRIRYVTIISAYAPTLSSPDDAKEQFYEQFDQVIGSTPPSDKLVILGDFNARVGRDCSSWEGILGRHGVGKKNDNNLLLLSKCAEHSLCITNNLFRMADKYKTTWMHPRSKHWHLIDFIIVCQRDMRDVRVTHTMRGTECLTDQTRQGSTDAAPCAAPWKPTQDCQGRLQCPQAEGPILPGTIPANARQEAPRSCDPRRQHWEMDLFQRNSQWDWRKSLEWRPEPMKTGLMRMTKRSKKPYMPRTSLP